MTLMPRPFDSQLSMLHRHNKILIDHLLLTTSTDRRRPTDVENNAHTIPVTVNEFKMLTKSPVVARIADRSGCQCMTFKVIQRRWFSFYLKVNMQLPISDHGNLSPILHRLATVHPWRTDKQTDDNHDNRSTVTIGEKNTAVELTR